MAIILPSKYLTILLRKREGFCIRFKIRNEIPEEQRLPCIAQERHQLPLYRQQVVKSDEHIGSSCYLFLNIRFFPSLNHSPLTQTRITLLLRLHLSSQSLIERMDIAP